MRSLVLYNYKIIGITEEQFSVGDIVETEINNEPITLVVNLINDKPTKIGIGSDEDEHPEEINISQIDSTELDEKYDKIIYLIADPKIAKKYKKKTSQKLEKRMAQALDGNTTPGSGAFAGNKGDIKSKIWLGEHKYTDKMSYRLKHHIWSKIAREASQVNRLPILEVVLDQTNEHIKLMFIELSDFCDRTFSTEDKLVETLYFKQYKPSKNASSILLKTQEITNHIQETYNLPIVRIPALLITFTPKLSLIGFLSGNFEIIFPEV